MNYFKRKTHKLIDWLVRKSDYTKDIKHLNINTRNGDVTIINSPTGNCQMFSIKQFDRLLYMNDKKFKSIIQKAKSFTNKDILFLDINKFNLTKTLNKLNYCYDVIVKEQYHSSNGSTMVILILKYSYKRHNDYLRKLSTEEDVITRYRFPGESRKDFFFRTIKSMQ